MIFLTDSPHERIKSPHLAMIVDQIHVDDLKRKLTCNGRNQLYSTVWQPCYTQVQAYCDALGIDPNHTGGIGFHIPNAQYPIILRAGDSLYYPPKFIQLRPGHAVDNNFQIFIQMRFKLPE